MCLGFAAMLLFLKPVREEGGKYYGSRQGEEYLITDDNAAIFAAYWRDYNNIGEMVQQLCRDERLWEASLDALPGFSATVAEHLQQLQSKGVKQFIHEGSAS